MIEITEIETPVEITRYGLMLDTGGAGRWCGGMATAREFKVFAPDSRVTVRNPRTPQEKRFGNIDYTVCSPTMCCMYIPQGTVDDAATTALRAEMVDLQRDSHFHVGPERDAFETVWAREAYAQITDLLVALPVHWRFFVKTEFFARLGKDAQTLQEAFKQVRGRFPQVPDVAV